VAAPMRLLTTMPPGMLMEHYQRMFPGAERPKLAGGVEKGDRHANKRSLMASPSPFRVVYGGQPTGTSALAKVLTASAPGTVFWASDFEKLTGVEAKAFRRYLTRNDHLKALTAIYGWRFVTARDLGLPGKRLGILREAPQDQHEGTTLASAAA
jgi:hypothetical protein